MAPSPENDSSPKAPDKEKPVENKDIVYLNDKELKALLDEAITYKNPKDREGKSELFKGLLSEAEESERIARAASAGGSELVRHCNPSARRHGRHGRRKPSSISENVMHGGSLDNLAKEELFESAAHQLHSITRKPVRVSARQREGGSLPCNVNSRETPSRDYQFLEEAKKNKAMKDKEYTAIDMETVSLIDNDHLQTSYQQQMPSIELVQAGQIPKFTSKATLQICGANVDDPIPLDLDGPGDSKKTFDREALQNKVVHSKYQVFIPTYNTKREADDKKVDENGNALNQKPKKKKTQIDKNVVVLKAESVEGHRSEIINDLPKLLEYIEGSKNKSPNVHGNKSKQLHKQHTSEDGVRSNKKQRAQSSKGKEERNELKKSNSLGEISTAKLDDFAFSSTVDENVKEEQVILRNKPAQIDRPRERRSWGNVEPPPFQTLYTSAPSAENLETLDNWVVTKTKKKCKKRRNSVSSGRSSARQNFTHGVREERTTRAPSPDLRGKSACSMPHSEKSNDSSSDVDSVHSLPIDGPVSYAAIARNSEKKDKKNEKVITKDIKTSTVAPTAKIAANNLEITDDNTPVITNNTTVNNNNNIVEKNNAINTVTAVKNAPLPPDVHNFKNFPTITGSNTVATINNNNNNKLATPNESNKVNKSTVSNKSADVSNNNSLNNSVTTVPNNNSANNNNNGNKKVSPASAGKVKSKEYKSVGVLAQNCCTNQVGNSFGSNNNSNSNINNSLSSISGSSSGSLNNSDIQNDLSIIQANERDSIQYNAQMLPPDIPDVQTIEKMHFMNRTPQNPPTVDLSVNHSAMGVAHASPLVNHSPVGGANNAVGGAFATNESAMGGANAPPATNIVSGGRYGDVPPPTNVIVCDKIDDRTIEPPPVVILSGCGDGTNMGLVFGFEVNEQLLKDDVLNFISRYAMPEVFSHQSHNHDKIVNFIGSAWEAVTCHSSSKVQYYSEDL